MAFHNDSSDLSTGAAGESGREERKKESKGQKLKNFFIKKK